MIFFSLPTAEQENQARSARLENRLFYSGTLIKIYLSATPRTAAFYILTMQGRFLFPCVNWQAGARSFCNITENVFPFLTFSDYCYCLLLVVRLA